MGYLKYQLEGEQISFGNGEWFFTGNKRKTDKVAGRYTSSEGCEGQCNECNIVTARYSNGETYSIPYDCNAENSYFNINSLYEINDYAPTSAITSLEFGDCVTSIDGALCITSLDSLTSITFSNSSSLKAIGENFRNVKAPKITEIRFPSSLRILDNKILSWDMPNLERVILNDGIKWIGNNVFSGTKIRELVIPSTVEHLGSIEGIKNIEKVTFISETPPKYLDYSSSSSGGFEGVVYVPCGSVNEYKRAFEDASWYDLVDRITCEEATFRIRYTMSDGLKVALPCNDGYVSNGDIEDFLGNNVVNIEFSECTKNICANFSGFTSLNDVSLTIPNANICRHAFENTSGITSLAIGSGCTFETTNATESTFANMPDLIRVTLEEGLVLGDVDGMFSGCTSLTSVTIPNNITTIPSHMLEGCTSLTSLTIPDSVTKIGMYAFQGCTNLTNVNIPSNISIIDGSAFQNCSSLQEVVIPNTISKIGQQALLGCTSLTSITIEATTPPEIFSYTFEDTNNCPIYVPCDSVSSYTNSWGSLSARIRGIEPCNLEIMVYVTYIEGSRDDYVKYCDGTSMYIPDAYSAETVTYGDCVTSINNQAFANSYNLKSVTISNSVTSIGDSAFDNCRSLASIIIPDSVTSIGSSAFNNCTSLSSVTIGSGVTSISKSVFFDCRSITSVTIPDSVTSIGNYAFNGCISITSVTIGSGVTTIGIGAFYDCSGLTSITIPDSVTSISIDAFYYCTSLSSVTIGSGVTTIGNDAFNSCSGLTSITIPDSVTSIGSSSFYDCTSIANVTIGNSVKTIGNLAFNYCRGLTSVTIPDSVTSIGEEAFDNCTSLTSVTVNALTPPKLGNSVFDNTNDCPIYVPAESANSYKSASGWSTYKSRIQPIPNS